MAKIHDYFTVCQAAAYLGVSPNTIRAWGGRGKIKERRNPANQYRLYRKADLDRFLKRIEQTAKQ